PGPALVARLSARVGVSCALHNLPPPFLRPTDERGISGRPPRAPPPHRDGTSGYIRSSLSTLLGPDRGSPLHAPCPHAARRPPAAPRSRARPGPCRLRQGHQRQGQV